MFIVPAHHLSHKRLSNHVEKMCQFGIDLYEIKSVLPSSGEKTSTETLLSLPFESLRIETLSKVLLKFVYCVVYVCYQRTS